MIQDIIDNWLEALLIIYLVGFFYYIALCTLNWKDVIRDVAVPIPDGWLPAAYATATILISAVWPLAIVGKEIRKLRAPR